MSVGVWHDHLHRFADDVIPDYFADKGGKNNVVAAIETTNTRLIIEKSPVHHETPRKHPSWSKYMAYVNPWLHVLPNMSKS
ncbi:hypothetical protein AI2938V1_2219 [Escherichia coli]|nr:hypothetical protein AI2938V1_2219 [Escherichia coli]